MIIDFTTSSFLLMTFALVVSMACTQSEVEKRIDTTPYQSIFGPNVLVFDAGMDQDAIQLKLDELHKQQARNQFGNERYALLFKPGSYDLDVTVDYYVQALGLGQTPGETLINGTVQSTSSSNDNKVTIMFWRGAENFKVIPRDGERMLWAVSQAAPYRRMHVAGDINFDKGSWASGGVLANSIIEGRAGLTSGQQWFTRNSSIGYWEGGNWNQVFVGVEGAPEDTWPEQPTSVIDRAPVIREKPSLIVDENGIYQVFVPAIRTNSRGVSWNGKEPEAGELLPISSFYIAFPDKDNGASINQALADGKHLLLTPGLYELEEAIRIENENTVVLGVGLPTLIPTNGNGAIETKDVSGLKIAGVMVDAGIENSTSLITIGESNSSADHSSNPTSLHDLYCRVGGAIAGQAEVCLTINSNDVIGDHFWLWRADHGKGADWEINKSRNGLIVNGEDVTIYGLFNEHFQGYQTYWAGERGRMYFYQSEIPYKPPSFEAWNDEGKAGFASYKVAETVQQHQAWGLGIYSFFQSKETVANKVRLENAVESPTGPGIMISHIATFAGINEGINHVINGKGPSTEVGELNFFEGIGLTKEE